MASPALAQDDPEDEDLKDRIKQLEERVKELEGDEERDEEPEAEDKDEQDEKDEEKDRDEYDSPEDDEGGFPWGDFQWELPLSLKLKVGGQLRLRGEFRDSADLRVPGTFGRDPADDPADATDFILMRTRLSFDVQVVDPLRVLVELQDSRTFGDQAIAQDSAEFHLRQGFMEIQKPFDLPVWLKAGRFEIPSLGDVRLLWKGEFNNVARSWDGFQATWRPGYRTWEKGGETKSDEDFMITGFLANIREGAIFAADQDENDDFWFSGIYASVRTVEDHEFDAYIFWRHLSDRIFTSERSTRLGDRKDFTLGVRVYGEMGPLSYSGEIAWQWGDQAGDRIRSWAAAVRPSFTLDLGDPVKLIFTVEYAYARGDQDPNDGKLQTFDPLFNGAHIHHGHSDLFSWQNMHQGMFGLKLKVLKNLSFHIDAYAFWLDKRKDSWFGANKTAIRRDPTGAARSYVGSEVDFYVRWKVWKRLSVHAGYSRFTAGQYVRDTTAAPAGSQPGRGSGGDQDWLVLQAQVNF